MPYGMDAFMLGIGMLGKPKDRSPPQLPAVPGSLEALFREQAGWPRAALLALKARDAGGCWDLFAITTCPLVAPGKTANLSLLPCDSWSWPDAAICWAALAPCDLSAVSQRHSAQAGSL